MDLEVEIEIDDVEFIGGKKKLISIVWNHFKK